MGNNHDKYFGKDKRKVLVLGLPECGKTCNSDCDAALVETIVQGKQANLKVQKTKDLSIRDANLEGLNVTFFDLAGGERQRIFWKQHYEGTQGVIFLIDVQSSAQNIQNSFNQFNKISQAQNLSGVPIAICLHKTDLVQESQLKSLEKNVSDLLKNNKIKTKLFFTNYKNTGRVKEMITWLLKQTKPL